MLIQGQILHKMGGGSEATGSRDKTGIAGSSGGSAFDGLVLKASARQRPADPSPSKKGPMHHHDYGQATHRRLTGSSQSALTAEGPLLFAPSTSVPTPAEPSAQRARPAMAEGAGSSAKLDATKANPVISMTPRSGLATDGRQRFRLIDTVPAKGKALSKVAFAPEFVATVRATTNALRLARLSAADTGKSTLPTTSKMGSAHLRAAAERLRADQGRKRDGGSHESSPANGLPTVRPTARNQPSTQASVRVTAQASGRATAQTSVLASVHAALPASVQIAVRQPDSVASEGSSRPRGQSAKLAATSEQIRQGGDSLAMERLVSARIQVTPVSPEARALRDTEAVASSDAADVLQAKLDEQVASSRFAKPPRRLHAIRNGSQAARYTAGAAKAGLADPLDPKMRAVRKVSRGRQSDPDTNAGSKRGVMSSTVTTPAAPLLFKSSEYAQASLATGGLDATQSTSSFTSQASVAIAVEVSQLARYVMNRLATTGLQNASVVELTLVPEHLGKLRLTLDASKAGTLRVHMATESSTAGALIESQKGQLQQQLSQGGFASVMVSVSTDSGGQFQQPQPQASAQLDPMNADSRSDDNAGPISIRASWLDLGANAAGGFYAEA